MYRKKLALIMFVLGMFSQSLFAREQIEAAYDRPGLTTCFITYGNREARDISIAADSAKLPAKFFNNNLSPRTIQLKRRQEEEYDILGSTGINLRSEKIREFIEKQNIGRKIVSKWYNFRPEKGFDLSTVFSRAEYNATDEEINVSESSKRGRARIRDYGHNLVDNSYLVVIDLRHIEKEVEKTEYYREVKYKADAGFYLCKLKFGEEQINELFSCWVNAQDPPEEKARKIARYKKTSFPMEMVYAVPFLMYPSGRAHFTVPEDESDKRVSMREIRQKARTALIEDCYRIFLRKASKEVEALRVKRKVMHAKPVKAKIGKKESLVTDAKYFVYEYVWDDEEDKALPRRKAVIRARDVANNRDNQSALSTFYQVYGGTVDEGMVLREHPELGFAVITGYETSGLGGMNYKFRWRTGSFTGVPALYINGGFRFSSADYSNVDMEAYKYLKNFESEKISVFLVDAGMGKGWQFARFFELMPLLNVGMISTDEDENKYSYSAWYIKPGLMAGVNILHNLQAYGQINYYGMGPVFVTDDDDEEVEDMSGEKWSEQFPEQAGAGTLEFGLRFEF